jgi:D-apionolactonase
VGTVHLQAGPLSATLEGIDLFDVRYSNVIIAERIYAAVRDEDWNHVRVTWDALRVRRSPNGFSVRFRARFNAEPIDVVCVGTITGDATGRIVYELDGEAFNDFQYCKMGLCVHHALHSSQGRPYRARCRDRQWSGRLPDEVDAGYRMGALFREFDKCWAPRADDQR